MLRERRRAANNKPNRRLDRKSSRGMIYENEELRLRTININAEVERGQSDIRKLRRENETLRREIWALRDEYDRLDKLLSGANFNNNNNSNNNSNNNNNRNSNNNNGSHPPSGSSGSSSSSGSSTGSASSGGESENNSCDENEIGEKLNATPDCETLDNNKNLQKSSSINHSNSNTTNIDHTSLMSPSSSHYTSLLKNRDNLHVNFDHLSIVSEENLTSTPNSPSSPKPEILNDILGARQLSPIDPVRTLTPLNELQSVLPSLYHFENLSYETLGPSIDSNGQILKPPHLIAPFKLVNPPIGIKSKPPFFGPMRPSKSIESLKNKNEPMYATIKKSQKIALPTASSSAILFQNGGNLEDLLKEITLNPIDSDDVDETKQPDIVAIEGDKIEGMPVPPTSPRKHRSQINLVLNYNNKPTEKSSDAASHIIGTSNSPSVESPPENRLNRIGFEKFVNTTTRPEHIYSTVDTPSPKVVPTYPFNGLVPCNGNGIVPVKPPDKPIEKLPPIIDVKRKSRRVSLCFNGRNTTDTKKGRRASIDVVSIEKNLADFSNSTTPFQRRHSTHHHHHHNNHHASRKSSHESVKILQSLQSITKQTGGDINAAIAVETNGRRSLSRESTSSIITQKSRKASGSSQGGKIPWCACWGNGCF